MPRIDYAEADDFHSLYDGQVSHPRLGSLSVGYARAAFVGPSRGRAQGIIRALATTPFPLTAESAVAVIGAGFGWTVEGLLAEIPGIKVVGVDVSAYVDLAKTQTETDHYRARITAKGLDPDSGDGATWLAYLDSGLARAQTVVLNEDIKGSGQVRNTIKDALNIRRNQNITHAISDDLATSLEDQEVRDNVGAMNSLAVNCAHLIMPLGAGRNEDTRLNWKTMEQWRTLFDSAGMTAHRLVRTGDYAVF